MFRRHSPSLRRFQLKHGVAQFIDVWPVMAGEEDCRSGSFFPGEE
jgi:hypothetical protein